MQSTLTEHVTADPTPPPAPVKGSLDFDFTSNTTTNNNTNTASTSAFDFSAPSSGDADLEALLKLRDMSLNTTVVTPVNETPNKKNKKKADPLHGKYPECSSKQSTDRVQWRARTKHTTSHWTWSLSPRRLNSVTASDDCCVNTKRKRSAWNKRARRAC